MELEYKTLFLESVTFANISLYFKNWLENQYSDNYFMLFFDLQPFYSILFL